MTDRRLRIGVDGRELVGRVTGVGRYIGEVLTAWARDGSFPHEVIVFTPDDPHESLRQAVGSAVTWEVVRASGGGTVWEQWHLPRAARRHRLDVFFAGAYTAPVLLSCPTVLLIHDVSYFAHPEWFSRREGFRRRWLTRLSVQRARVVLTVSAFSADETARHLAIARTSVLVAHGGTASVAQRMASGAGATVLYVGSLFNRRLIPELIAGFARAAADVPAARLVLVGENRTHPHVDPRLIAAQCGIRDRVDWRDYVTDAELDELYASARAFAFLSTYEGFGLTPLEAIARGVPVVLLDTPVAHEIYDDAALFVPPDPGAIGAALRTLLEDDDAHQSLLTAGRDLLTRYSWTRTAATIRGALERAAGLP